METTKFQIANQDAQDLLDFLEMFEFSVGSIREGEFWTTIEVKDTEDLQMITDYIANI